MTSVFVGNLNFQAEEQDLPFGDPDHCEAAAFVLIERLTGLRITGEWLLGIAGALSILFGVAIAAMPGVGALVMAFWFGTYAFLFGVVLLALGFRLRNWSHRLPSSSAPIPANW